MSALADLATNPVFTGVLGGSLVAGGLYALKAVPGKLWDLTSWRFSSEIKIYNDDPAFDMAADWLSSLDYAKRARQIRLTARHSDDEQRDVLRPSPGLGTHLIWRDKRPVLVSRWSDDKSGSGSMNMKVREGIIIRTLGSTPELAHKVIEEIVASQSGVNSAHVCVYLYRYGWRLACRKEKRSLGSVVMPEAQRHRIVGDIEKFQQSRAWYRERGIPYRRGLLFQGPPGTGKTSLVLALAAHFSMRIYALNLGSMRSDDDLIDAVTSVPENAILLIEDIDAAQRNRAPVKGETESAPTKAEEVVTMSGLLNAIDGVFSRDGRVLVMTTNHPDRLDEALRRPGRADRIENIDELGAPEVRTMCCQFLGSDGDRFAMRVKAPIRPAELQRLLLDNATREIAEAAE